MINTHAILFLNDNVSAMFIKTSQVSLEHEKHVLHLPMLMNQRVGHHHASDVNAVIHMGIDKICAAQAPLTLAM